MISNQLAGVGIVNKLTVDQVSIFNQKNEKKKQSKQKEVSDSVAMSAPIKLSQQSLSAQIKGYA